MAGSEADSVRATRGKRPFLFWDGEGYTDELNIHHYMLYGCSTGDYVQGDHLTASECLDLMLDVEAKYPNAIHVIFAGGYDVVKIIEAWPLEVLELLYRGRTVEYMGYSVSYIPGKSFRVSRDNISVTLYDIFSYFGTSFVKACQSYLGDIPELAHIQTGKEARGQFQYDQLESTIKSYWESELALGVQLATKLRDYLAAIGLRPATWHGPGAVANTLMRQYGIRNHLSDYERPDDLQYALQCAYAGGRFELFRAGWQTGPIYQYDINSAYPWAITRLPDLRGATWRRASDDNVGIFAPFSLYRAAVTIENDDYVPGPLFWRDPHSLVFYPHQILSGWYWGVELENLTTWFGPNCYEILESWEFTPRTDYKPFSFMHGIYAKRQQYKREKNPTEFAAKIAMNCVYGKTIQHTGYDPIKHNIPQWHQLEWGGWITAAARAKLYDAIMTCYSRDPDALIAVETDAIFSTISLSDYLPIGDNLGEWKETQYESILYIQNGVYWTDGKRGKAKTRGIEAGNITFDDALDYLRQYPNSELRGQTHRFGTLGQHRGKPTLGQWFDQTREIKLPDKNSAKRGIDHARFLALQSPNLSTQSIRLYPADAGYCESQPYNLPWVTNRTDNRFRERNENQTLF